MDPRQEVESLGDRGNNDDINSTSNKRIKLDNNDNNNDTNDSNNDLSDEDKVRVLLIAIFAGFSSSCVSGRVNPAFDSQFILGLLQRHPNLATEKFFDEYKKCRDVLGYFLQAQCDLATIQALCSINLPKLKEDCERGEFSAIFDVCVFGAKEGVLEYLLDQFPKGASFQSEGFYPAQCLFYSKTAEERSEDQQVTVLPQAEKLLQVKKLRQARMLRLVKMLRPLLEVFPEVVLKEINHIGVATLLRWALGGFDDPMGDRLIRLICNYYPYTTDMFPRHGDLVLSGNYSINLNEAIGLSFILPKLVRLKIDSNLDITWSVDGLHEFFDAMTTNRTIGHLELWLRARMFSEHPSLVAELKFMLKHNRALWHVEFGSVLEENCDSYFQAISEGTRGNTWGALSHVELFSFTLSNARSLGAFVSDCRVKTLELHGIQVEGGWEPQSMQPGNKLTRLIMHGNLLQKWCMGMVSQLPDFLLLEEVWLLSSDRDGLVPFVPSQLFRPQKFTTLELDYVDLDLDALGQYFRCDNKLKKFRFDFDHRELKGKLVAEMIAKALENDNKTLAEVQMHHTSEAKEEIDYYCTLNQAGRAMAAREDVSLAAFVGLFEHLEAIQLPYNARATELRVDCIRYGLLRLRPELWSQAHSGN